MYPLLIVLAWLGFLIAGYIFYKKRKRSTPACPLRSDCHAVIHSAHSKFLGLPVELLGMAYYGLIVIGHAALMIVPETPAGFPLANVLATLLLAASALAVFFSIYLTIIQTFVIRQLCAWCLASAFISVLLFIVTIAQINFDLFALLLEHRRWVLLAHLAGFALGLGGATISDVFFMRFIKNKRVGDYENEILTIFSQVVWTGLGLLVISGLGFYLPNAEFLNESPKFLVKMIAVAVVIVNGTFLNIYVAPRLLGRQFGEHKGSRFNRITFACGAISAASWYTAFILGTFRTVPFSFPIILALYLAAVLGGITVALIQESRLEKPAIKNA